jgi:hypothetical protein
MKKKEKNNELELHQSPEENYSDDGEFESYECYDDDIEEIKLDEGDFQDHKDTQDDDENAELDIKGKKKKSKGLKKSRKKAPQVALSEEVLYERSIYAMIFGLLSCSVFFGNLVFALLGIGFALSTKRHKYKSAFSNAGLFAGLCGLVLSLLIVLVPVLAFLFLVLLVVVLGLLELLLILIAVVLLLIVNPMTNLLVEFLINIIIPAVVLLV